MIKAILFDADGVILAKREKLFSDRLLESNTHIDLDDVKTFFKNEYKDTVIGTTSLEKVVEQYLQRWKWQGSVVALLDYWYSGENTLNDDVIQIVRKLRSHGTTCHIVADHPRYRADNLMTVIGLDKLFDSGFYSGYLGCTKDQPKFFKEVLKILNLNYDEVLLVDDEEENTLSAQQLNIQTLLYKDTHDLILKLESIGISI